VHTEIMLNELVQVLSRPRGYCRCIGNLENLAEIRFRPARTFITVFLPAIFYTKASMTSIWPFLQWSNAANEAKRVCAQWWRRHRAFPICYNPISRMRQLAN